MELIVKNKKVTNAFVLELITCLVKTGLFLIIFYMGGADYICNIATLMLVALIYASKGKKQVGIRILSCFFEFVAFMFLAYSVFNNPIVGKIVAQVLYLLSVFLLNLLFADFEFDAKKMVITNKGGFVAAGITFCALMVMFICKGVLPFGNNTVMIGDGIAQYLPFFSEYRYKLINHESMFFTWNIGMGVNFFAVFAYYITSPFNFLFLFVSRDNLILCVHVIWVLKIVLSSFAMSYYLTHRTNAIKNNYIVVTVSVAYALNNFVFGFANNIMWLDCIILLPIVILGFEKMLQNNDKRMYICALATSLYCNYYISYMICITLVLLFFVKNFDGVKDFFVKGVRFALSSIISAMMVAFLLIPSFIQLQSTSTAGEGIPEVYLYNGLSDLLNQLMFGVEPIINHWNDGELNVYCGILVVCSMFIYALNSNVSKKTRIKVCILVVFMFFSCIEERLNFIWHGFHDQLGVPNRFGFIIIFILLAICADVLCDLKNISTKRLFVSGIACTIFFCIVGVFSTDEMRKLSWIISILMTVIYFAILARNKKPVKVLSVLMVAELIFNMLIAYLDVNVKNIDLYFPNDGKIDAVNEYIKEEVLEEDEYFYRCEFARARAYDEVTWYNMPSFSTFCTTINGDLRKFLKDVGAQVNEAGYFYVGSTPFMDSIFGIRYMLERDGDLDVCGYDYITTKDEVNIYQTPYPLSIGYAVDEALLEWEDYYGLAFDNQNEMIRLMTGTNDVFVTESALIEISEEVEGITELYPDMDLRMTSDNYLYRTAYVTFTEDRDYYIYIQHGAAEKIVMYYDDKVSVGDYKNSVVHIGERKKGDVIRLDFIVGDGAENVSPVVVACGYNADAYEKAYDILSENQYIITDMNSLNIKGNINVLDNQIMFTSIPYDSGWEVYVDGEKQDINSFHGLIYVELSKGTHDVEFKYMPVGMGISIVISFLGMFATCVLLYMDKRRRCA